MTGGFKFVGILAYVILTVLVLRVNCVLSSDLKKFCFNRPPAAVVTSIRSAITGKPGSDKNTGADIKECSDTELRKKFVACVVLPFIPFVVKVTRKNITKGCFYFYRIPGEG
jgi:hypothetical protein